MKCEKHPEVTLTEVCGELGCGACYGEQLNAEPYRPAKPLPKLEWRMDASTHGKLVWIVNGKEVGPE